MPAPVTALLWVVVAAVAVFVAVALLRSIGIAL